MTRSLSCLSVVLVLCLIGWALPCARAQIGPSTPGSTPTEQFDEVFQRVVGPGSMDASRDDYDADLERLNALLPSGDTAREVKFRSVYCGSDRLGDYPQALAYSTDAVQRASAIGDVASQARALFCKALYVELLDNARAALAELETAATLLEGTQERQLLAEIQVQQGILRSDLGDQAAAMMDFQRARAGFREAGITREVEALMLRIAVVYRRIGDWPQAEAYFAAALQRMVEGGNWSRAVTIQTQLGYLYDDAGTPEKSMAAFENALAMSLGHEGNPGIANVRIGLASAQIAQGQGKAALATLAQAKADYQDVSGTAYDRMFHLLSGQALASIGEHRAAMRHFDAARPLFEQEDNPRHLVILFKALSASEEALGRNAAALSDFKRYSQLQLDLKDKMRLEQNRLLEYNHEIQRRDLENQTLRAEASARQQQVTSLQRERRLQLLALTLGSLLLLVLVGLIWRQLRHAAELRTLAMTDPLTGLMTRRAIEAGLTQQIERSMRFHQPLTVLVLDLDHFKQVNDTHGHAVGDAVLRDAALAWKSQLRDLDLLGRLGGEEFMAVCPNTDPEQAATIASRLLDATRKLTFPDLAPSLRTTVSIGIAHLKPNETEATLVARADAALYRAKEAGRDRHLD